MASPNKKPHLALETPDTTESSSSSSSSGEESGIEEDPQDHGEIQVEFEARTAEACDFHGIKSLLKKLFEAGGPGGGDADGDVDLSALTEFIIDQRSVGSVITQSRKQEEEEEEDDDDDGNDVFGVTSVIRITGDGQQQSASPLGRSVGAFLLRACSDSDRPKLSALLSEESGAGASVGLIVSERIMNIPPQISVPLYETLFNEIRKAKAKKFPFDFTHYLLVSRRLRFNSSEDSPASLENAAGGGGGASFSVVYVNAEEEILEAQCEQVLDVRTAEEKSSSSSSTTATAATAASSKEGEATSEGANRFVDLSSSEYSASAKMLVMAADKADQMVDALKKEFPLPP